MIVFLDKRFKTFSVLELRRLLFQHVHLLPATDVEIFLTATVTKANRMQILGVTRVEHVFFYGLGSVHHGWKS